MKKASMTLRVLTIVYFLIIGINEIPAQQPGYFSFDRKLYYSYYTNLAMTVPVGVNKVLFTRQHKNKTQYSIKRYNDKGNMTSFQIIKNGDTLPRAEQKYNEWGYVSETVLYAKGKIKSTTRYETTDKGLPVSQQKVNGKNKVVYRNEWKYNSQGDVTEILHYRNKNNKLKQRWVYEYYDTHKLLKTTLYNKKGKVKQVWNYGCDAEGEKMEKKKNTSQVCIWSKVSDTILIKTYQTFDEKGRTRRNVYSYTIKDTLPIEWRMYNHKNQLARAVTYKKSYDRIVTDVLYNKKGNVWHEWRSEYSDTLLVKTTGTYTGKINFTRIYTYNSKNWPVKIEYMGTKRKSNSSLGVMYLE